MIRTPLSVNQLYPGQVYRIIPYNHQGINLHDGMALYQTYYYNFNCRSQRVGYSPNTKYFDVYKNNMKIDPNVVKLGDVITLINKVNLRFTITDVTVTKIAYVYEFSKYVPALPIKDEIMVYSTEIKIYEPFQRMMEIKALKELDTIELTVIPGGHNPRTLINDVIHRMKPYLSMNAV